MLITPVILWALGTIFGGEVLRPRFESESGVWWEEKRKEFLFEGK